VKEFGLAVMDATKPVELQQRTLRQLVLPYIRGGPEPPAAAPVPPLLVAPGPRGVSS